MAPAKVLWFVVLRTDGEPVRETVELGVALAAKRAAGPGARIVQEKRLAGERTVLHYGAGSS